LAKLHPDRASQLDLRQQIYNEELYKFLQNVASEYFQSAKKFNF